MRNSISILLMLALHGSISGCGSFDRLSSTRGNNWEVAITELTVVNAEEDKSILGLVPLSNGDEPYIIMISFRSRFGTSNTTNVQSTKFVDLPPEQHFKAGEKRRIPADMGIIRFENVLRSELIGVVVIAFESDRTPRQIINAAIKAAEKKLETVGVWSVESQGVKAFQRQSVVEELHRSMQQSVGELGTTQTTGKAFEKYIFSAGDTDEVIGMNSIILMNKPPIPDVTYPQYRGTYMTDVLMNRASGSLLRFESQELDARYEAVLEVRKY